MVESFPHRVSDDTTLHVLSSGSKQRSLPTLIFLHFWGGSARTFTKTIACLSQSYHTLAIDFPGWGTSTGPSSVQGYSIRQLASNIESPLQRLDITNFVLVGHSMGGKVAQLIAGREAVPGLQCLILIAPAPPTPLVLPGEMREQQETAYNSAESAEFVVRNILSATPLSDETVQMLVEDMLKGNELAKAAWPEFGMAEDVSKAAERINVPTLVIAGELDRVEPVERLKSEVLTNISGSTMVDVTGKGHLLPVEAQVEAAQHIEQFIIKKIA